jgi:hypothetical protein
MNFCSIAKNIPHMERGAKWWHTSIDNSSAKTERLRIIGSTPPRSLQNNSWDRFIKALVNDLSAKAMGSSVRSIAPTKIANKLQLQYRLVNLYSIDVNFYSIDGNNIYRAGRQVGKAVVLTSIDNSSEKAVD